MVTVEGRSAPLDGNTVPHLLLGSRETAIFFLSNSSSGNRVALLLLGGSSKDNKWVLSALTSSYYAADQAADAELLAIVNTKFQ